MVTMACPFCGSEDVRPYGTSNGKKRYACNNRPVRIKYFMRNTAITAITATGGGARTGRKQGYRHERVKKRGHDRIGEQGVSLIP
jgi:hypothetical protein